MRHKLLLCGPAVLFAIGGEGLQVVGIENGDVATSCPKGVNAALEVTLRELSHDGVPHRPHKVTQSQEPASQDFGRKNFIRIQFDDGKSVV